MKPKDPLNQLLYVYVLALLAFCLAVSCSPVKRVLKDPAKINTVGLVWEKTHPCVTDSVVKYLPGETVVVVDSSESAKYQRYKDSLLASFPTVTKENCLEIVAKYSHTIDSLFQNPVTIRTTKTVRDTLKVTVADLRREHLLNDEILVLNTRIDEKTKVLVVAQSDLKRAKTKNTIMLIIFVIVFVGSHYLRSKIKIPFL